MTSFNELLMSHVVVRGVDTSVPPHKRVQAAWREWEALGDSYVARIARNGLQFDWIPGFDPLHPDDNYRPFSLSPYARDDLDDDEVLQREIDKLILAGHVSEIEPEDAKCVTSIFLVEKKPDPENPQGSSRPCTNLKLVNRFIHVTYFSLPTLREILPYLKKGYYACKLDLKSAYFHMPIAKRDAPWLAFRHRGRVFKWDCLPFGLNIAPREWQRMMLPVLSHLRRKGVLLWVYLHNLSSDLSASRRSGGQSASTYDLRMALQDYLRLKGTTEEEIQTHLKALGDHTFKRYNRAWIKFHRWLIRSVPSPPLGTWTPLQLLRWHTG